MAPKSRAPQVKGPKKDGKGPKKEGKPTPTRVITDPEDMWSDTETGTLWKIVSSDRIRVLLKNSPHQCSTVKKLGLLDTFCIEYARPDWQMVKEYILNFDEKGGWSLFQGRKLPFNIDVLRDAFKLPAGDPSAYKAHWKGPEMDILFTQDKIVGGKYCLDWLAEKYQRWEGPLRVVTELLLGRRRPSSVTGKIMWYFRCYLWKEVPNCRKPDAMPDWAQLMHEDLKNEVTSIREHLLNGKPDPKNGKSPKYPPFYGSSAIMHLLLYFLQERGTAPILNQGENQNAEESVQAASAGHPGASQEVHGRKRRATPSILKQGKNQNAEESVQADSAEHPGASQEVQAGKRRAAPPTLNQGENQNAKESVQAASAEHPVASQAEHGRKGRAGRTAPGASQAEHGRKSRAERTAPGASQAKHGRKRRAERTAPHLKPVLNQDAEDSRVGDDEQGGVQQSAGREDIINEGREEPTITEEERKRISELEGIVLVEAEENKKLQAKVNEQEKNAEQLRTRNSALEREVLVKEEESRKLQFEFQKLESKVGELENERQSLQQQLEKATNDAAGASKKVESLQETGQGITSAHRVLCQKYDLVVEENSSLQSKLNAQRAEVEHVKESMEGVRKDLQEAQRVNAAAESEVIETRKTLQEVETNKAADEEKIREQSDEIRILTAKWQEEHLKFENVTYLYGNYLDNNSSEDAIAGIVQEQKEQANKNPQKATTSAQQAHTPTSTTKPSRPQMYNEGEASPASGSEYSDEEAPFNMTFKMATDNEPEINMSGSNLVEEAEPPKGHLAVLPKEHQRKGLAWMITRESKDTPSPRGGILADDQGMGKTLQAIMVILYERPQPCSTIVVCPVAVLKQWVNEIRNMCAPLANVKTLSYHGPNRNKPAPPQFKDYDVVVTSYSTLEVEWEKHCRTRGEAKISQLLTMDWYRVILDEAHTLKNRKAKMTQAVFNVKAQTRWCLTGTPVQNTVEDLYSFFKVLGYDKIQDYDRDFKPIENRCKKRFRAGMEELRRHLSPFTLRRMKGILNLPPKSSRIIEVDFADKSHHQVYESIWDKSNTAWQLAKGEGVKNTAQTLALLQKCRQACDSPILPTYSMCMRENKLTAKELTSLQAKLLSTDIQGGKCNACQEEMLTGVYISKTCQHIYCDNCFSDFSANSEEVQCLVKKCKAEAVLISMDDIITLTGVVNTTGKYTKTSSKLDTVMKYVQNLPPLSSHPMDPRITEKVIVFSQWTSALNLVQEVLQRVDVKYERVDGTMPIKARAAALDAFSNEPQIQVLLLSLMAGNVGLNIVAANHVILLDGWWNPTVEDQAVDRCHRIGQTRPVSVIRIVVRGTIEKRILELQAKKRELHTSIFSCDVVAPKKRQSKQDQQRSDLDFLFGHRGN